MVEMYPNPLVQGFTTNPSLMRKAGVKDYKAYCLDLLTQVRDKPISFEVFADDFSEMNRQAQDIKTWGKNVYVKIPVMNSEGKSSAALIRDLAHSGVRLNVTAVFTLPQVWEVCHALKGGAPSILSIFPGRLADVGMDPVPFAQASSALCDATDPAIELLWASTREAFNVVQAEQSGCKIITAPIDVVKKVAGFGKKDAYALSLETVRTFKSDSEAAGFKL